MLHRFLCAVALSAAFAAPAFADQAKPAEDPVVARVNGVEIHRSDAAALLARMPAQVQQLPVETIFPLLVERLVDQQLVETAGYKAKLQKTDEVKQLVRRAEAMAVQQVYIRDEIKKRMTDAALQDAYTAYLAENPPKEEAKAAHILVKTEKEAKALIAKLNKGADFAKLAAEKSQDPGSAKNGGDLGYFTDGTMVEAFSNAAFALKVGAFSEKPVETQYGWHIIKLEDRRMQKQPAFDEIKPQLEEKMGGDIAEKIVKELHVGAKIEIFDINGKTPAPPDQAQPAENK